MASDVVHAVHAHLRSGDGERNDLEIEPLPLSPGAFVVLVPGIGRMLVARPMRGMPWRAALTTTATSSRLDAKPDVYPRRVVLVGTSVEIDLLPAILHGRDRLVVVVEGINR